MSQPPPHPADPWRLHVLLALVFAVLAAIRLTTPSTPMFDEVHYLPAARAVLDLSQALNMEHPPLAKQLIALGMALFGDNALGWRALPWLMGVVAIFAAMRAMWFATCRRAPSLLTGLFLTTGFPLLVQARIAMLDGMMAGFVMVALWMCAGAVRENETARWRLAIAGAALGAAMACKWNAIPLAMLPGLAFLAARLWQSRTWDLGRTLTASRGWPIGGMTLWEAGIWLGLVPLAVYALSYWPFLLFDTVPGDPAGLVDLHRRMLDLQTQVITPHPYQSNWWQWAANSRAIWYLYDMVDGAQRGVLMMGNPLSSLAMLPALAWCAWAGVKAGVKDGRRDCLAVFVLYAASVALWIVAPKPVQFFHHYFLPHMFGMAALALGVEALWQRKERLVPGAIVLGSAALFVWFYPILTAGALAGEQSFLDYAWIDGWR